MASIQVWADDELALRVARAAKEEGRSVSQWLRLLVERELDGRDWEAAVAPLAAPAGLEDDRFPFECDHPKAVKRETTFGIRRFCADPKCGALLP